MLIVGCGMLMGGIWNVHRSFVLATNGHEIVATVDRVEHHPRSRRRAAYDVAHLTIVLDGEVASCSLSDGSGLRPGDRVPVTAARLSDAVTCEPSGGSGGWLLGTMLGCCGFPFFGLLGLFMLLRPNAIGQKTDASPVAPSAGSTARAPTAAVGIYLTRAGQLLGPFTIEQLHSMWERAEVTPTDLFWYAGRVEWSPITAFEPPATDLSAVATRPPPLPSGPFGPS